jgi:hypothetical protein
VSDSRPPLNSIVKTAALSRDLKDPGDSGTPVALILLACELDSVVMLDRIDETEVATEWPLGPTWRETLGYRRFAMLNQPRAGRRYAFVASPADQPSAPAGG